MLRRRFLTAMLAYALLLPAIATAQTPASVKVYTAPADVIGKIKDEGLNRSQVMKHLSYLTDVIGGRLTNSPNMKRANEWTRDTMASWGMKASLEPWGPFGRGWALREFSAEVIEPTTFTVIAYPKAWSPGTKGKVTREVIRL
ncbi:peptidase M28, partial [Vibrio parahaemolyticus]|nr:peptidase M28 [Vibrio parahaemolyticus]